MMETAIWTVLAVGAMVGIFAACVLVVTVGVRWLEDLRARRTGGHPG
jgi:hypothetical protein